MASGIYTPQQLKNDLNLRPHKWRAFFDAVISTSEGLNKGGCMLQWKGCKAQLSVSNPTATYTQHISENRCKGAPVRMRKRSASPGSDGKKHESGKDEMVVLEHMAASEDEA